MDRLNSEEKFPVNLNSSIDGTATNNQKPLKTTTSWASRVVSYTYNSIINILTKIGDVFRSCIGQKNTNSQTTTASNASASTSLPELNSIKIEPLSQKNISFNKGSRNEAFLKEGTGNIRIAAKVESFASHKISISTALKTGFPDILVLPQEVSIHEEVAPSLEKKYARSSQSPVSTGKDEDESIQEEKQERIYSPEFNPPISNLRNIHLEEKEQPITSGPKGEEKLQKENTGAETNNEIYQAGSSLENNLAKPIFTLSTDMLESLQEEASVSSTESAITISSIERKSLEENKQQILNEFKQGLYVRTFSDQKYESSVVTEKIQFEGTGRVEKYYWSSASLIKANTSVNIYEGETDQHRCGFILSSQAKLGGWNVQDMGTPNNNVNEALSDEALVNFFPKQFPEVAILKLQKALQDELYNKKYDLLSKISPNFIKTIKKYTKSGTDSATGEKYTSIDHSRLKNLAIESIEIIRDHLLGKHENKQRQRVYIANIPDEYKSVYTFEEASQRLQPTANISDPATEYNEAKIHYEPNDILGILVFNNPKSIDRGMQLQKSLSIKGFNVPFVTYTAQSAQLNFTIKSPQTRAASEARTAL